MKHFTLEELCDSPTARRLGIRNTPSDLAIASLNALVDNILDPLREAFGRPIVVTSGFRCRRLNAEVGARAIPSTCAARPPTLSAARATKTAGFSNSPGN